MYCNSWRTLVLHFTRSYGPAFLQLMFGQPRADWCSRKTMTPACIVDRDASPRKEQASNSLGYRETVLARSYIKLKRRMIRTHDQRHSIANQGVFLIPCVEITLAQMLWILWAPQCSKTSSHDTDWPHETVIIRDMHRPTAVCWKLRCDTSGHASYGQSLKNFLEARYATMHECMYLFYIESVGNKTKWRTIIGTITVKTETIAAAMMISR